MNQARCSFLQITRTWASQWLAHGRSLQEGVTLWVFPTWLWNWSRGLNSPVSCSVLLRQPLIQQWLPTSFCFSCYSHMRTNTQTWLPIYVLYVEKKTNTFLGLCGGFVLDYDTFYSCTLRKVTLRIWDTMHNSLTFCFYTPCDRNDVFMYICCVCALSVSCDSFSFALNLSFPSHTVDVYGELFANSTRGSAGVPRMWPGKRLDLWRRIVSVSKVNTELKINIWCFSLSAPLRKNDPLSKTWLELVHT